MTPAARRFAALAWLVLAAALVAASAASGPAAAQTAGAEAGYRIDSGDKVSVEVYGEDDLTIREHQVKSDGMLSMPLIGAFPVRGHTAQEVEALVTEKLADGYLRNPHVTVTIDRYRLYFIKGEVRRPGGYTFVEGLTIQKAIALAGGLTERASESKISLVREDNPREVLRQVPPYTPVRPGDVVTVGQSLF
ncbi:MAG: polysaccharide export protein [Ectothiorhodospiraceae bacterium]|nr:polysaccharide export protein [Ectothiorhodospiraceae bacterium]